MTSSQQPGHRKFHNAAGTSPTPVARKKHAFRQDPVTGLAQWPVCTRKNGPGSATGTFIPARTLSAPVTVVFSPTSTQTCAVRGG